MAVAGIIKFYKRGWHGKFYVSRGSFFYVDNLKELFTQLLRKIVGNYAAKYE